MQKQGRVLYYPILLLTVIVKKKVLHKTIFFYQKDSRLVMAVGSRHADQEKCETVYYLVENNHFKQILNN